MMLSFFDTKGEWAHLQPHLSNSTFQLALNLYHWWKREPETGDEAPLLSQAESPDEAYVVSQLTEQARNTAYWYCVPHQCADLNAIVMGVLALHYLGKGMDKLYQVVVTPTDCLDYHFVVSDLYVSPGVYPLDATLLSHTQVQEQENQPPSQRKSKAVLYDLIYPLMPWFGLSWSDSRPPFPFGGEEGESRRPLTQLRVVCCQSLAYEWASVGYSKYPPLLALMGKAPL